MSEQPTTITITDPISFSMMSSDGQQELRRVTVAERDGERKIFIELWPDSPHAIAQEISPRGADYMSTVLRGVVPEYFPDQYEEIVRAENERRGADVQARFSQLEADATASQAAAPAIGPCPDWCDGHNGIFAGLWDGTDVDGAWMRTHLANVSATVSVCQDETVRVVDGERVTAYSEAVISAERSDDLDDQSAAELAAALTRASEILRAVRTAAIKS